MNYMPGTASLIQDIDSECSAAPGPSGSGPAGDPLPRGYRLPWDGRSPRGGGFGLPAFPQGPASPHAVGSGPAWGCSSRRSRCPWRCWGSYPHATGFPTLYWGTRHDTGGADAHAWPWLTLSLSPLPQRSTWSCYGTAGRSSGTCAASTSSVCLGWGGEGGLLGGAEGLGRALDALRCQPYAGAGEEEEESLAVPVGMSWAMLLCPPGPC